MEVRRHAGTSERGVVNGDGWFNRAGSVDMAAGRERDRG